MRKFILGAVAVLSVGGTLALANTITFGTPSGSTAGGESVSAQAVVMLGSDTLTIVLSNNTSPFQDAGQLLSDFSITLSNGNVSSVTGSGSGSLVKVGSGGSVTNQGTTNDVGWNLDASGNTLTLDGLNGALHTPKYLVLGSPCADGTYCDANGSIAGNPGHNPFIMGPLTFSLSIPGVTASTIVSDSVFSFSTTSGVDVDGVPTTPTVPEPADFALVGLGLIALGCARKRIFSRKS
ncbi:MAG: PEP-CTERM sorting domain-containing protein [Bryobacteraceae bacterium]